MFGSVRSRKTAIASAVLASALLVAACGGSSSKSESGSSTSTTRPRTTTTARAASSTTTTAAPNNCTADKITMANIPDPSVGSKSSLAISNVVVTTDSKYALVQTKLANGDPSNGLPYFFVCTNNAWVYKQGWTGLGMDCSTLSAAEVAGVVELAGKTSSQWACKR